MFIGRKSELEILDQAYKAAKFQMVVVYGRRRIGKTALLQHFVKEKSNVIFFTGLQTSANENLEMLSASIKPANFPGKTNYPGEFNFPASPSPSFNSYNDALTYIFDKAENEQTIFVIDEYPYLAESYPGISSLLQKLIDQRKNTSKLLLILCGSSMSFMEHQVLGKESPLYGRRDFQTKVEPFNIFEASKMLSCNDPIKAIELYSLAGGVPLYLEQLDATKSIEWNIANAVLKQGAFLSTEPENYVLQEMHNPASYKAIITAIAKGKEKTNDIANTVNMQTPKLAPYLKRLIELGIIEKVTPIIHANKKQVLYRLTDNLFRFWYRFAPQYTSAINADMQDIVAKHIVKNDFSTYLGPVFEKVCQQWLMQNIAKGNIPLIPKEIGCWWGNDPIKKEQAEVDIVITGANEEFILGECKWRNSLVDSDVLKILCHRAAFLTGPNKSKLNLYIFSKTGFTEQCKQQANALGNVILVTAKDLFK